MSRKYFQSASCQIIVNPWQSWACDIPNKNNQLLCYVTFEIFNVQYNFSLILLLNLDSKIIIIFIILAVEYEGYGNFR